VTRAHRPPRAGRRAEDGTVVLVAEQLRRPVPGGIGTYARGLVQGLLALEERPPLLVRASAPPPGPDPLARLGLPLAVWRLPGPLLVRAWDLGLAGVRGGALVHSVSVAAPPSGPPLVVTVHDLAWRHEAGPGGRRRAWHEAALARALRRAAHFVVPSARTAEELVAAGAAEGRTTVIEEGADHLPPPDPAATAALLARLGVASGYLLAVGTLEPRKNLPRLLAGYAAARPRLPEPWPLVVAGPPGWGEALLPPPGVLLAGAVSPAVLAGLYAGARCCCYVPILEGFGLPVVEAMALGTPVVSSDVPSAGGASLLVDPLEPEAIAEAMVAAAADEECRRRLVAAGRARVAGLTWQTAARAHVALWRELAGGAAW